MNPQTREQALTYSQAFLDYLAMLRKEQVLNKVALRYTPKDPLEFAQAEATIHAKIDLLNELIHANMNPNLTIPEI